MKLKGERGEDGKKRRGVERMEGRGKGCVMAIGGWTPLASSDETRAYT